MASPAAGEPSDQPPPRLATFGDFRLRLERSSGDRDSASVNRMQLRTRLGGRYRIVPHLSAGGRLMLVESARFGGAGDVLRQLGDSHETTLDQGYLIYRSPTLAAAVGRFANPFYRADSQLLWDADYSPTGVAAGVAHHGQTTTLRLTAGHFNLSDGGVGDGSSVDGVQLRVSAPRSPGHPQVGIGYYDYRLKGAPDPTSSRYRGNLLRADGRYLSDFNLLNLIGSVELQPFGRRWPVELFADLSKNLGARTRADTGYLVNAYLGRADDAGDVRFNYAWSRTGIDSVFTPISQDNLRLGSNFVQHTLGVEYVPHPRILLSAVWYRYRPLDARYAGTHDVRDWLDRMRVNFNYAF